MSEILANSEDEAIKRAGKTQTISSSFFNDGFVNDIIEKQISSLKKDEPQKVEYDKLKLLFGEDFWVKDSICICQPTIQDFLDYEEKNIYATIAPFTQNTTSYRVQLWDMGIDWNDISDIELCGLLSKTVKPNYSSIIFKRIMTEEELVDYCISNNLSPEDIEKINIKDKKLLKPLELYDFDIYQKYITDENGEVLLDKKGNKKYKISLINPNTNMEINLETYTLISDYLRYMFNIHPEVEHVKSKALRKEIINMEKLEQSKKDKSETNSSMYNLISFALNHPGFKYKKDELREVSIIQFMDSIQRLQVYENTRALLQGSYSGMIDTKKINKKEFNFMRDI